MAEAAPGSALSVAQAAKRASRLVGVLPEAERNRALVAMAEAVSEAGPSLLQANEKDMRAASETTLSSSTQSRLHLTPQKIEEMVNGIRSVAALPDPLGRVLQAIELDDEDPAVDSRGGVDAPETQVRKSGPGAPALSVTQTVRGLHLQKLSVPLGVLLTIFEARPDAVTQIASLAIKSGNTVILKPGSEVEHTSVVLVQALRSALASCGLPEDAISLVTGREKTNELLALHGQIDMVVPRGGKQLVEHVQANTRIPVLGHAEGVCHIYVDKSADQDLALRVIADAKTDYPAACNAVETVLVHRDIAFEFLPRLAGCLRSRGVQMHGDETVRAMLRDIGPVADWRTEYGELALSIGVVESMDAAIEHIHAYGSSHTESILTEDDAAAEKFLREVDAAGVFHNCSTRFADGFRYGFGAEVGIATSKLHARGPVGLEGLTTYKYVLRGHGHIAGDYRGPNARQFMHRQESGR